MSDNENPYQEAKRILHPIKQRPDLNPSTEFTNELHNRLLKEKTRKRRQLKLYPIFAFATAMLILSVIIITYQGADETAKQPGGPFKIEETSQIRLVDTMEYGIGEGDIGLVYEGIDETLPVSVAGFDIQGESIYILDEARSQVVMIDGEGKKTSFPIQNRQNASGVFEDILVTETKEIYILNTSERAVYRYQADGELLETYDLSTQDLFFPDTLSEWKDNEVVVSQNQEKFVSLKTMRFIDSEHTPYHFQLVNRKESKLLINEKGEKTEITLFADLGIGNRSVNALTDEQIIVTQTVTPPVYANISETHVLALDREGTTLGGIRVPVEKFIELPQRVDKYIATEGDQFFMLIPEKEHVALYEMSLGKEYESFIEEQVEEVEIGFDYQTFGKPFPELEAEIRQLFTNGEIEYGHEDSLNGVAIDEKGTVVIDFKDFLAPSPASGQAQPLGEALHAATFEKFPEITQIYFQFDGSFSAWCYWLASTEEPWVRQAAIENEAFRIFEPVPNVEVSDRIEVNGLARVFEGTIQYEFGNGQLILDKGFTTASEGAPGWGEFTIIIELEDVKNGPWNVTLYEESQKDGSRLHEITIPVQVKR